MHFIARKICCDQVLGLISETPIGIVAQLELPWKANHKAEWVFAMLSEAMKQDLPSYRHTWLPGTMHSPTVHRCALFHDPITTFLSQIREDLGLSITMD